MARELPTLQPRSRKAWRAWLEKNHASSSGIWVVYAKKHTGLDSVTYVEAVEEALCFGWIDSLVHPIDDSLYKQIFTPRKERSAWSALNKKRVEQLIESRQMTAAGMKMIELAKANGQWDAHAKTEALTMPPALKKALNGNASAKKNWPTYTLSQQKAFLRMLDDAKTAETRAKRIARILDVVSNRMTFSQLLKPKTASRARGSAPSRRPR
ncbi:MAG TPA: YdeI/OmpD-associated family protein [Vicinamibacterales bacterium]|jgi:uncharacterized protein YdeI (YjbR/CyaY-like superfamily)